MPLTIDFVNPTQYGIWLTLSSLLAWFSFFDIGLSLGFRNRFAQAKANGVDERQRHERSGGGRAGEREYKDNGHGLEWMRRMLRRLEMLWLVAIPLVGILLLAAPWFYSIWIAIM